MFPNSRDCDSLSFLSSLDHVALFATPDPFLLMRQQSFSSLKRTSQVLPLRVLLPTILLVPVDSFSLFLYVFHYTTDETNIFFSVSFHVLSSLLPASALNAHKVLCQHFLMPHFLIHKKMAFTTTPPRHTHANFILLSEVANVLLETQSKRLKLYL